MKRVLIVALIAFGIGGGLWLNRQLDIDRCLDIGGRWDYERGECEEP